VTDRIEDFSKNRIRMNNRISDLHHLGINRFFNLDQAAYQDGVLPGKTKELLGLVASLVLRCNDCIDFHIIQCVEAGWTDEELIEAFNIGLVVGGSIVVPHLRHAVESLDLVRKKSTKLEQPV
jgi:AhpD family alkylhydroperoxidase